MCLLSSMLQIASYFAQPAFFGAESAGDYTREASSRGHKTTLNATLASPEGAASGKLA